MTTFNIFNRLQCFSIFRCYFNIFENRYFIVISTHFYLYIFQTLIYFNVFQHLYVISTFLSLDISTHFDLYIFQSEIFQHYSYSKIYFNIFQNHNLYFNYILMHFKIQICISIYFILISTIISTDLTFDLCYLTLI